jgi:hypothetical protein
MKPGKFITFYENDEEGHTVATTVIVCPLDNKMPPSKRCLTCTIDKSKCELATLLSMAQTPCGANNHEDKG